MIDTLGLVIKLYHQYRTTLNSHLEPQQDNNRKKYSKTKSKWNLSLSLRLLKVLYISMRIQSNIKIILSRNLVKNSEIHLIPKQNTTTTSLKTIYHNHRRIISIYFGNLLSKNLIHRRDSKNYRNNTTNMEPNTTSMINSNTEKVKNTHLDRS